MRLEGAFRRILLRPDLIHIVTTDIPGDRLGRTTDIFTGHLAMPFGWVASPAFFEIHTDAITAIHSYVRPRQSLLSGEERFTSSIYADDCMLIECPVGNRLSACASCWEWSCQQILGDDSINNEKKGPECHWSQKHTLLGFEVDAETMTIKLPDEKIQQEGSLVLSAELMPGNYGIIAKTLQQLRGLCVHWLTCNPFWYCLCRPIDFLLSHVSESGMVV